jgi:hypothetical protein
MPKAKEQPKCFARGGVIWNDRRIEARFAMVDGRLECVGLEIGPAVDPDETFRVDAKGSELRPLTAAEMRFPLRRVVDTARGAAIMVREGTDDFAADMRELAADADALAAAKQEPSKRPGRPPQYDRDHYRRVAEIYRDHEASGGRTPTKAVQEKFKVTKSTAAKWVARARQLGELKPIGGSK